MRDLKKYFERENLRYVLPFSAAYLLPILLQFVCTVFVMIKNGSPTFIALFLVGFMAFSPFYGLYYAVCTVIHVIVDAILASPRTKKLVLVSIISSAVPSMVLSGGCLTVLFYDLDSLVAGIGVILMMVGAALIAGGFFVRMLLKESIRANSSAKDGSDS